MNTILMQKIGHSFLKQLVKSVRIGLHIFAQTFIKYGQVIQQDFQGVLLAMSEPVLPIQKIIEPHVTLPYRHIIQL